MITSYFDFVNSVSTGREYETRNYSFEEVNHHMAEQLQRYALSILLSVSDLLSKYVGLFSGKGKYVTYFCKGHLKLGFDGAQP